MKKVLLLLLTLSLFSCKDSSYLIKNGTLTIGISRNFYPMSYIENGELTGFEVDLIKEIVNRLNLTLNLKEVSWMNMFKNLDYNHYDCIIGATSLVEYRMKNYNYTMPYLTSGYKIVYNNEETFNSLSDLHNMIIGVQPGTIFEDYLESYSKENNIIIERFEFISGGIDMLESKKINAMFIDEFVIINQDLNFKEFNVETQYCKESYIVIYLKKENNHLTEILNRIIQDLRNEGFLEELSFKYFNRNIIFPIVLNTN